MLGVLIGVALAVLLLRVKDRGWRLSDRTLLIATALIAALLAITAIAN